eukprot:jgi/Ulvmu1/10907/UM007_0084.1
MGIGSSSRFKRDAEFLIGCASRQARLQKLITKQCSKIIATSTSFSLLVSLARVGDCSALLCALDVSRQALISPQSAAQRDLARKLKALFGSKAQPSLLAQCIFTYTAGQSSRVTFGRLVVPRIDGAMPFLAAAEAGHWHVVLWMASEGVNVLTHDERTGFGVLHAAARGGQPALLQHLLQWDIEVLDSDGAVPLHSSRHRTLDGAEVFNWVDFPAMGRVTPLMVAAFFGKGECVRVLIQAGADVNVSLRGGAAIPLPSGSSVLHCAARSSSCQGAVELLKAVYTAAGGPMVDNASNSSMRLQWEGDPALDLRARPNNLGVLPTNYAGIVPGSVAMERMLHPRLPVALVIRQEDPAWTGFDGGVPRLYALALDALRKYHLSTLDALEHAVDPIVCAGSPASTCFTAVSHSVPWGSARQDSTMRGSNAAAMALAAAASGSDTGSHDAPVIAQFASASRDNLLSLQPPNRSMSTQSLSELPMPAEPRQSLGHSVSMLGAGHAAGSGSLRQPALVLSTAPATASTSAGALASIWPGEAALDASARRECARSGTLWPRRSRSPFQMSRQASFPLMLEPSVTPPLRAQGRAAGSGVGASSSTWHGGCTYEEHAGASHGHFRFFSAPGSHGAADALQPLAGTPAADAVSDALEDLETESEMELQWALYTAQLENTRHSMKGADRGGSARSVGSASGVGEPELDPTAEPVPLLSRMAATVDRAALRVPHMLGPSLRGALRAGGDTVSTHSGRSATGQLEGGRRSLVSTMTSMDHDGRCPICMDERICVSISGCKHGMCLPCARTLCTSVSRAPLCPMCRQTVDTFEQVEGVGAG